MDIDYHYNQEQARRHEAMQMVLDFSRGKSWSFKELLEYAEHLYNYINNGLEAKVASELLVE